MLVISAHRSTGTEGASLKDKVGEIFPPILGGFVKFYKLTGKGEKCKLHKLTECLSGGRG